MFLMLEFLKLKDLITPLQELLTIEQTTSSIPIGEVCCPSHQPADKTVVHHFELGRE